MGELGAGVAGNVATCVMGIFDRTVTGCSCAKGVVKGQKAVPLHAFEVILQVGRVGMWVN